MVKRVDYGDNSGSCKVHQVRELVLKESAKQRVHQTKQYSLWIRVMY
jgi:hypothetical protein